MGYKNRVGNQGFVTEDKGVDFNTNFTLENHIGHSEPNTLYVLPDGTVEVNSGNNLSGSFTGSFSGSFVGLAQTIKYEFYEHQGSQTISDVSYTPLKINAVHDQYNGGLHLWNTSSNVFKPIDPNGIYTIRITGKTGPTGGSGNQTISIAFALSGSDPNQFNPRHGQEYEILVRSGLSHMHIFTTFTTFMDQDLLVSGAQIYTKTTVAGGLELLSCSIFIKEG
jgi:hypothetical protein